ncbi:MAG: MutS-related protein, partial [Solirubrobacteraceae bacterium]
LLHGLDDVGEVEHRQGALSDSLANPAVIRDLYELAGEALAAERQIWATLQRDSPRSMLGTAVQKLEVLATYLRRVRAAADEHAAALTSPAFTRMFETIARELDDAYLARIDELLHELRLRGGMLLSARLGSGAVGAQYTLRRPRDRGLLERLLDRRGLSFTVPERDESGLRALSEIEDRGVNAVAAALTESVDHVHGFFVALRAELAFYVGCLTLHDRLTAKGEPTCMPGLEPLHEDAPPGERSGASRGGASPAMSARNLYDVCLTLTIPPRVVANDLDADGRALVVVTGANQGGKSTFLRSIGVAQLMAQCGMFAPARSLHVELCAGVYSHFKREEDEEMGGGKLDDELRRMSEIADRIAPGALLLCNESFASTNEREGSEIARQVIRAMVESGVRVLLVTHMFDLAHGLWERPWASTLFLRAQRGDEGARTYRLDEGEPLPTSHGADSFDRVFGRPLPEARATARGAI